MRKFLSEKVKEKNERKGKVKEKNERKEKVKEKMREKGENNEDFSPFTFIQM